MRIFENLQKAAFEAMRAYKRSPEDLYLSLSYDMAADAVLSAEINYKKPEPVLHESGCPVVVVQIKFARQGLQKAATYCAMQLLEKFCETNPSILADVNESLLKLPVGRKLEILVKS